MSVEIVQENNVVEIIEEDATLVEVITAGPQGPQGLPGLGFSAPIVNPPSGLILDGSVIHADGPKTYTFPLGASSVVGIKMKALSGTITILASGSDVVEEVTLTGPQAFEYSPNASGWVAV